MEDVPVKCFICCTTTEKYNSKTIDHSNKIVGNCLTFLHSSLTGQCSESNRSNSLNYVTFCKECFHSAENLTQRKEQRTQLKEQKTQFQERQTQLQEQQKQLQEQQTQLQNQQTQLQQQQIQLQQQLKNVKKEMYDSSIEFSISVLHRRSQNNKGEDQPKKSNKQIIQLDVTDLPEIYSNTTPNVEAENIGGTQTAQRIPCSSKSNNQIIETDALGLPSLLFPIQPLQSVSDQNQVEERFLQIPLPDVQSVHERDIVMQESIPDERGVLRKHYIQQQVETEKSGIGFSSWETQNYNLSVDCGGAEKEGLGVQLNEMVVEPVFSDEEQGPSNIEMEDRAHHAGNVKLGSLTERLNLVKAMLDCLERYPFKCSHCERRFTLLNELQLHLQICTEKSSNWERRNPHKLPPCRIIGTHLQNSFLAIDVDNVYVCQPRHPDEVITENTFKCEDCNKVFSSPSNLLAHKRVHTDKLSKVVLQ